MRSFKTLVTTDTTTDVINQNTNILVTFTFFLGHVKRVSDSGTDLSLATYGGFHK
jgi:hypothetical protein